MLDSFNGKKILEDDFSGKNSVNKLPLTERFAVLILTWKLVRGPSRVLLKELSMYAVWETQ